MKKFILGLSLFLVTTMTYAESRGDTVYTCHWHRDGWMWTSGSYTACKYMVIEKLGSNNYRIESLEQCEGQYSGDTRIVSGNSLFSSSAINFSNWGNKCKSSYVSK